MTNNIARDSQVPRDEFALNQRPVKALFMN